jgi:hypothetical protein
MLILCNNSSTLQLKKGGKLLKPSKGLIGKITTIYSLKSVKRIAGAVTAFEDPMRGPTVLAQFLPLTLRVISKERRIQKTLFGTFFLTYVP